MKLFQVAIVACYGNPIYVIAEDISKVKKLVDSKYDFATIREISYLVGEVIIEEKYK